MCNHFWYLRTKPCTNHTTKYNRALFFFSSSGEEWDVVYSERLGRTSYTEQYAYYYRYVAIALSLPRIHLGLPTL